jgi:hypothetical protein
VTKRQSAERLQREREGKLAAGCVHAAVREKGKDCCTGQSCETDAAHLKGSGCVIVVDEATSALA